MTQAATLERASDKTQTEHFDVIIVGAGISGVGGAYHLTRQRPNDSFLVLEALEDFGGTWRSHTYPGIRSDSDLYTFGYRFKPWVGPPIASAAEILTYMGEVIADNDLGRHIRYRHKITQARWSSQDKLWTLDVTRGDGSTQRFTTGFLWMCQGYYRQLQGYTPQWPGMSDYQGQIIHPQEWPKDLDYKGKKVVVIGSGATAATLVPAIAGDCAHVTLLQRSPTYFVPGRNRERSGQYAARTADRRKLDPRDRAPQGPVRPGDVHPTRRRRAGGRQGRVAGGRQSLPGRGFRHRQALHALLSPLAPADRLRAGRRPVPGHRRRARRLSSPTRSSASPRPACC